MDTPSFDAEETASTQAQYDKEAALTEAQLNRIDEFTPYGSSTYSTSYDVDWDAYNAALDAYNAGAPAAGAEEWVLNPDFERDTGTPRWIKSTATDTARTYPNLEDYYISDVPKYTRTTTYSPDQQQILDLEEDVSIGALSLGNTYLDRIAGQTGLNLGQFEAPTTETGQYAYESVRDALYRDLQEGSRFDEEALATRLANQGIPLGSEAYGWEQDIYNEALTDAYYQAALYAGDEQTRQYNLAKDVYDTQVQNYLTEYYSPYNELASLLGYSSGVTTPTYGSTAQVDVSSPDYSGLKRTEYDAETRQSSGLWGDLFGLGGSLGSAWIMG